MVIIIDNADDLQPYIYMYQPFTVISSGKIIIHFWTYMHGFVVTVAHLVVTATMVHIACMVFTSVTTPHFSVTSYSIYTNVLVLKLILIH